MHSHAVWTTTFARVLRFAPSMLAPLIFSGLTACGDESSDYAMPPPRPDSGTSSDGSAQDAVTVPDATVDVSTQPDVGRDTATADTAVADTEVDMAVADTTVDTADASSGCGNGTCDDDETCTSCPSDCGECPTLDPADRANVLAAAGCVRNNPAYAVYFEEDATRAEAYEMMTLVIRDIRTRGTDASRCIAHGDMPSSNPYRWCSDALVVGPPGAGITIDIYQGWPVPGTPQIHISGYNSTGELTADLSEPFVCQ